MENDILIDAALVAVLQKTAERLDSTAWNKEQQVKALDEMYETARAVLNLKPDSDKMPF